MKHLLALLATLISTGAMAATGLVAGTTNVYAQTAAAADAAPAAPAVPSVSKLDADLTDAIAIANAAGDTAGAACYAAEKAWVDTLPLPAAMPELPSAVGPISEFARVRVKVRAIQAANTQLKLILAAGVPDSVTIPCAPVVLDAQLVGAKIIAALGLVIK